VNTDRADHMKGVTVHEPTPAGTGSPNNTFGVLALVLAARPQLLILDEPTNHLSAVLVDELTEGLLKTSAAVVVATHDRQLRHDLETWPTLPLQPAGEEE
jgi:ABC-type ATPase involved in cell division